MDVMASSLLPPAATERHYYMRLAVCARAGRGRNSQVETIMKKTIMKKNGHGKSGRGKDDHEKAAMKKTIMKKDGDVSQKDDNMI
jgi:hypothetical protein